MKPINIQVYWWVDYCNTVLQLNIVKSQLSSIFLKVPYNRIREFATFITSTTRETFDV